METENHIRKSREYVVLCDHILSKTYPVLKDPKLLMRCIEYLFLSMTNAMAHFLTNLRLKKEIPPFSKTFTSKFLIFNEVAKRYNFDQKDVGFIKELHYIVISHKQSAMEFTKNNDLVICSDEFETKRVSENLIKEYLAHARKIIQKVEALH